MEQAAARRQYEALHEARPFHDGTFTRWSTESTPATPYRFDEGVDIFVSETDLNPTDAFLTAPDPFAGLHDSDGGGLDGRAP